jgi:hypothetical protein
MSEVSALWESLRAAHPDRIARVSPQFGPKEESMQAFLNRLYDLTQSVSLANEKCGTVGNPYETAADDLEVLLCVAQKLSGQRAQHRHERTNF